MRNNRLLQLNYRPLNIYFKDSLAWIPIPLAQFSTTFGLTETKGHYPHRLTTAANIDDPGVFGPGEFPALEEFLPYEQKPKQYAALVEWHRATSEKYRADNLVYSLRDELDKYCEADVKLLAAGVLQFRDKFMELNYGFDPFRDQCTNSSSGLACFRTFYYDDRETPILLMGENSLRSPINKSRIADAWLSYEEKKLGRPILREYRIGRYSADGCDPESRTVFEFYGCVWHGCETCTRKEEKCPVSRKTMTQLREDLRRRKQFLSQMGYTLVEVKKS